MKEVHTVDLGKQIQSQTRPTRKISDPKPRHRSSRLLGVFRAGITFLVRDSNFRGPVGSSSENRGDLGRDSDPIGNFLNSLQSHDRDRSLGIFASRVLRREI